MGTDSSFEAFKKRLAKEEAERQAAERERIAKENALVKEGAQALRDIFGEKAEAVVSLLADIAKFEPRNTNRYDRHLYVSNVEQIFKNILSPSDAKTEKPKKADKGPSR